MAKFILGKCFVYLDYEPKILAHCTMRKYRDDVTYYKDILRVKFHQVFSCHQGIRHDRPLRNLARCIFLLSVVSTDSF